MSSSTPLAANTGSSVVVERCQICDEKDLKQILFLGYMPPVNQMPPVGRVPSEQPAYPALLLQCPNCSLVQIYTVKIAFKSVSTFRS